MYTSTRSEYRGVPLMHSVPTARLNHVREGSLFTVTMAENSSPEKSSPGLAAVVNAIVEDNERSRSHSPTRRSPIRRSRSPSPTTAMDANPRRSRSRSRSPSPSRSSSRSPSEGPSSVLTTSPVSLPSENGSDHWDSDYWEGLPAIATIGSFHWEGLPDHL